MTRFSSVHKQRMWALLAAFLLTLSVSDSPAMAADEPADEQATANQPTTITTGSGEQYKTTVHRETEGELSAEDLRQASLLGSRILVHLNNAVTSLDDEQIEAARNDLQKTEALSGVIRKLLPTTTVTTVVTDHDGKEVYRDVDRVQDDRIPIFEGAVAVEIIQPIAEAQEEEPTVQGIQLADAQRLNTSALLDLSYVDRKISRAMSLLDEKQDEALAQLLLAQTNGIRFSVNKQDDPLVDAQAALRIAERMVEQERYEAAKANLQLAKNHLEVYRGLIPKEDVQEVRDLESGITRLQRNIEQDKAAELIRGFWDQVTGWFTKSPGEAQKTTNQK